MRVKLRAAYTDTRTGGGAFPGEVVEVEDHIGADLVGRGLAEEVGKPKKAAVEEGAPAKKPAKGQKKKGS